MQLPPDLSSEHYEPQLKLHRLTTSELERYQDVGAQTRYCSGMEPMEHMQSLGTGASKPGDDMDVDGDTDLETDERFGQPSTSVFSAPGSGKLSSPRRSVVLQGDEVVAAVLEKFGQVPPKPSEVKAFVTRHFSVSGVQPIYFIAIYIRCYGKPFKNQPTAEGEQCRRLMETVLAENPTRSFSAKQLLKAMQQIALRQGESLGGLQTSQSLFKSSCNALIVSLKMLRCKEDGVTCFRLAPPGTAVPEKENKLGLMLAAVGAWKQDHPAQKPTIRDIKEQAGATGVSEKTISAAIQAYYDCRVLSLQDTEPALVSWYPGHPAATEMLAKARSLILQFPRGYVVSHEMLERNLGQKLRPGLLQQLRIEGLTEPLSESPVIWVTTTGPATWSAQARAAFIPPMPRQKDRLQITVTDILKSIQSWMRQHGLSAINPREVQDSKIRCALGKLRICLQTLEDAGTGPCKSAAVTLKAMGLTLSALQQVPGLPNFEAEMSGGIRRVDAARKTVDGAAARSLNKSVLKLQNYLDNMPLALRRYFTVVSNDMPARLLLADDQLHPPVAPGDDVVQRLQSYFAELLWILLQSVLRLQEVQAQYLKSGGSARFDHVVISANGAYGCEVCMKSLGLDPAQARLQTLADGQQFRTWTGVDLMALIRTLIPSALEKVSPKHREVLERHILKLLVQLEPRVAQQVSVHIPVKPRQHAELMAVQIGNHLGIDSRDPPTGTRLHCLSCAAELRSQGYETTHATTVYASQLVPYEKLLAFLQAPGVQVGTHFNPLDGRKGGSQRRMTRRRHSTSPPPDGVSLTANGQLNPGSAKQTAMPPDRAKHASR